MINTSDLMNDKDFGKLTKISNRFEKEMYLDQNRMRSASGEVYICDYEGFWVTMLEAHVSCCCNTRSHIYGIYQIVDIHVEGR